MIEAILGSGLIATLVGGLVGYGKLQSRVESQNEMFGILRGDIGRLDQRVADLTDFLLREFHGEDPDQIRRPAQKPDPARGDR